MTTSTRQCVICDRALDRIALFYDPNRTVITRTRSLWFCTTEWVSDLSCVEGWKSSIGNIRHPRFWRFIMFAQRVLRRTPKLAVQKWIT